MTFRTRTKVLVAMLVVSGALWMSTTASAFNSHKLIELRARGLASIVWSAGGGQGENLGSLFSTATYDTGAFANAHVVPLFASFPVVLTK